MTRKPTLSDYWESVLDNVARTRPKGIDKQTEVNTWVATYQDAFFEIVPQILDSELDVEEIRETVEKACDNLILETAGAWGSGH